MILSYRLIVIVDDYDVVGLQCGNMILGFECFAAGQSAVSDEGDVTSLNRRPINDYLAYFLCDF